MGSTPHEASAATERKDRRRSIISSALFAVALGVANVAVPLLAIETGYSPVAVGILVALSAVTQVGARIAMGTLLRYFRDRALVASAAVVIGLSCGTLLISTSLASFTISLLLQGIARALFWTGSQTHAVRGPGPAVKSIQRLTLAAGVGSLIGPALAGLVATHSLSSSLLVGLGVGLVAAIPAALLRPFPPFPRIDADLSSKPIKIWRRKGVVFGSWMGVTAGSWKAIMNSYVPVLLAAVGTSAPLIGALVSIANVATLGGSAIAGWVRGFGGQRAIALGVLPTGLGIAAFGALADNLSLAAIVLAVSGLGAGILQTVGPAIAADWALPEERGNAIASVGTTRAAALLLAPLAIAGLIAVVPVGTALVAAGCVISVPAVLAFWRKPGLGEHVSHQDLR